jgi:hypothetical protein
MLPWVDRLVRRFRCMSRGIRIPYYSIHWVARVVMSVLRVLPDSPPGVE